MAHGSRKGSMTIANGRGSDNPAPAMGRCPDPVCVDGGRCPSVADSGRCRCVALRCCGVVGVCWLSVGWFGGLLLGACFMTCLIVIHSTRSHQHVNFWSCPDNQKTAPNESPNGQHLTPFMGIFGLVTRRRGDGPETRRRDAEPRIAINRAR